MVDRKEDPAESFDRFWPSWRYGPGGEAAVFNSPEEVPEGWEDHPSKVKEPKPAKQVQAEAAVMDELTDQEIMEQLSAAGLQFNKNWPRSKLLAVLEKGK